MKKKKLGFWSIVLLTINGIIGTGIFLSPGGVVKTAGTMTPFIYLCAAIFAGVLAITFASAAKYVTKGGAAYAYTKVAFGKNVGFYVGVTRLIASSIAWGVMATGVIRTFLSIIQVEANFTSVTIGFIILMAILLIINISGTRVFEFISNLSTIGKVTALVTTIVIGIVIVITTGENHFSDVNSVVPPMQDFSVFIMAVIAAFYAFTGFESVATGSKDMENPEKNLPRAIPMGILAIAAIYIGIVSVAMIINSTALTTSTEVVVLASIFENPIVRNIVTIGALISMFGINVASSFITPRVMESLAIEKQLPKVFEKRTKADVPLNAFVITALIAIIIPMAFQYDMKGIMIISSISRFVQFLVVPAAVIYFYLGKSKEPLVEGAKKSIVTDVVFPILSLLLTILLLAKFDWVGQFSIADANGGSTLNYFAIIAMILGYIIFPILLHFQRRDLKEK